MRREIGFGALRPRLEKATARKRNPKNTAFIFNNSVFFIYLFLEISENEGLVVIINMDKNGRKNKAGFLAYRLSFPKSTEVFFFVFF